MKAEAVKARILLLSVCEKNRKGGHDGIGRARPADAGKTGIWRAMLDAVNHTLLPPSWFSYHCSHNLSLHACSFCSALNAEFHNFKADSGLSLLTYHLALWII